MMIIFTEKEVKLPHFLLISLSLQWTGGLDTVQRIGKYPEGPKTIWKNLNLLLTNSKYVIAN